MVAIGRPSPARLALLDRMAGDLPALLLVLTPIALLNVLVATRPAGAPGPAEADAVVGASGATAAASADIGFLGQLSVLQVVAGAARDSSLLQSARGICLLAGLVSAALLWPVLRRLGLGGNAATTAVIVAGLGPIALRLQPSVDPGAVAAVWIGLAAAVGFRVRPGPVGRVVVLTALAAAAVTSLVAAAGLLAAGAYALAGRTPVAHSRSAPHRRRAVPAAVLAGVAAVASMFPAASGGRPAGAVPLLSLVVLLGLAAVAIGRAWAHRAGPAGGGDHGRGLAGVRPGARAGPAHRPAAGRAGAGAAGRGAARDRRRRPQPAAVHRRRDRGDGGPGQRHGHRAVAERTAPAQLVRTAGALADRGAGAERRALGRAAGPGRAGGRGRAGRAVRHRFGAGRRGHGGAGRRRLRRGPHAGGPGGVGRRAAERLRPAAVGPARPAGRRDRVEAGGQPGVRLPEPARQLLQEHRVDGRLAAVLAGAALVDRGGTANPVEVVDFPVVPGEPPTALRRSAVLAGVTRAVDVNGRPAASALELYLNAQPPPLRPELRPLPDGRVVVHFRLPIGG